MHRHNQIVSEIISRSFSEAKKNLDVSQIKLDEISSWYEIDIAYPAHYYFSFALYFNYELRHDIIRYNFLYESHK